MTVVESRPLEQLPHAPGRIPWAGDLTSIDRRKPTQHELTLSECLGPIFARKIFGDYLVIVSGADLATQCDDEQHWARGLVGPGAELRRLVPDGLFTARNSDPVWGQARRILSPGFTQASMRIYHDAMQSVADDLVSEWTGKQSVDVHSGVTRATLEVIGRAGFGRDLALFDSHAGQSDSQSSRQFVRNLADVMEWAGQTSNDLPVIGHVREALRTPGIRRKTKSMSKFVDAIVAERRASEPRAEASDLLDLMLTSRDPDTGEMLSADNVRSQVLTFLIAGHETTAALLEVALHYLASNRSLQDAVLGEVRGRGGFGYDDITGMRLLRNVVSESMRLWPPVPGYFRVARSNQVLGGYEIPAGRAVLVLTLAAQRDPKAWGATASQFDPQRFDAAELRKFPDRFYRPWGTGPRSCIGRAFATHEATLLLARLIDSFDLTTNGELSMRERGTLRPEPFAVQVKPRT